MPEDSEEEEAMEFEWTCYSCGARLPSTDRDCPCIWEPVDA